MNPLYQLRDEIANLHLLADRLAGAKPHTPTLEECEQAFHEAYGNALRPGINLAGLAAVRDLCLASRSPSHDLVEAADAMYARLEENNDDSRYSTRELLDSYDRARARYAEGAQPDSACDEIGWLVEITGPRYWTGTPGCGNWTADSLAAMRFARRQDAEAACRHLAPSGAIPVEHAWVSHRPAGAQPSGAPAPASAQGEVCEKPDAASPVKTCPFGPVEASVERFLRAIEARLDVDDDDAHILSRDGLELLKLAWSNRRSPAPSPATGDSVSLPSAQRAVEAIVTDFIRSVVPTLSLRETLVHGVVERLRDKWREINERSPATGESATPPSEQTAKELDELLAVFAKGDGDDEDCWTQPARRAQLYVASLRSELNDAQVQEYMSRCRGDVLAEINDGLRAEVDRLRTALAEKERAGVDVAVRDVLAERAKQRAKWTEAHDDGHGDASLAAAASVLAHPESEGLFGPEWSFDLREKRPHERERCVVAAALLLAEIERLDRRTALGAKETK